MTNRIVLSAMGLLAGTAVAAAQTAPTAAIPIPYQLDRDAKVSMLITGPDGQVVRELLHADGRSKGPHQEPWDGMDEQGKPVAAGNYAWKLLATQGLTTQYLLTVGTNPTPRWDSWPGNHGAASTVAVDASGMYVATGCGEGTILAVKQTMDGRRLWTIPGWLEPWCGPVTMASDGGQLYMLETSGKMYHTPTDKAAPAGNPWEMSFPDDHQASVYDAPYPVMDMTAGGGQLVVSYARQNLLRWIDPKTGRVIDTASVPHPFGVAVDSRDGSVLVISQDQVLRLRRNNKQPQVVIPAGQLVGPRRLAVDPSNGDILVQENWRLQNWVNYQYFSKDHLPPDSERARTIYHTCGEGFLKDPVPVGGNQVKRFTGTGQFLQAYGSPQGAAAGKHAPCNFLDMGSLAATPDGGFAIGENGLTPRSAVFDKAGHCLHEWFGGWAYAQHAVADPADPSIVWITDRGRFIKTHVDYANKSWQLLAAYRCPELAQWFCQDGPVWRIIHRGNLTYFALIGWQGPTGPCLLRLDETTGRMFMCDAGGANTGHGDYISSCVYPLFPEFLKAHLKVDHHGSWTWADLKGDGIPTADELDYCPWWCEGGGWYINDDFVWYFHSMGGAVDFPGVYRMAPKSWTSAGVPVYSFNNMQLMAHDVGWGESVWGDAAGNFYTNFNRASDKDRTYGIGGWSGQAAMNRVAKYDPTGKLQWVVGQHTAGSMAKPGEGHYLLRISGMAKGCVVVSDMVEGGGSLVWDRDGLWVGNFFENPVIGPDSPRSAYEQCGENFGGSVFTDRVSGAVYYIGGAINNCPIYRVSGWDQFQRQSGTFTVTPEMAASFQKHVQLEAARTDVIHIAFRDEHNFKLDGDLNNWQGIKPLIIKDGEKTLAKVYLAWNTYYIYAAFDVTTPTPWKNRSTAELAFQGGAAVDLNAAPLKLDAAKPLRGVYRVVTAPIHGKTQAVEFCPLLPVEAPDCYRTDSRYKTLFGQVKFDRAARLE